MQHRFNPLNATFSDLDMYFAELAKHPVLTEDEELDLAIRSWAGDIEARWALVRGNLRLVVAIARELKPRYRSVPLSDLIQEGNVGLVRAVATFDPSKGAPLAFWARGQISNSIRHAWDRYNLIRTPRTTYDSATRQRREKRLTEAGRQILECVKASHDVVYADLRPGGARGSAELAFGTYEQDPSEAVIAEESLSQLRTWLAKLDPRWRRVVEMRFGLADGTAYILDAVAEELNISRERARQLECKALARLADMARREAS